MTDELLFVLAFKNEDLHLLAIAKFSRNANVHCLYMPADYI